MVAPVQTPPHPFAAPSPSATDQPNGQGNVQAPAPDQPVPAIEAAPEPAAVPEIPQAVQDQLTPERLNELQAALDAERANNQKQATILAQIEKRAQEQAEINNRRQMQEQIDAAASSLANEISRLDNVDDIKRQLVTFTGGLITNMQGEYARQMQEAERQRQEQEQQEFTQNWERDKPTIVDNMIAQHGLNPLFKPELMKGHSPQDVKIILDTLVVAQQQMQQTAIQQAASQQITQRADQGAYAATAPTGAPPQPQPIQPGNADSPQMTALARKFLGVR